MKTTILTTILFSMLLLIGGNLQTASAQNLSTVSDYSIKLALTPSHIESGQGIHHIGYVYILNKHGVSITSSNDVEINLSSDNPEIAAVPKTILMKANDEFATFDVVTGVLNGKTVISASLNGKTSFQTLHVGVDQSYLPDDVILELNLPTDEMHVNSSMPFSVFLRTIDGFIVRAPNDIEIVLDYEKSLAMPNASTLTIKQGEYYAWGTISTKDKVGNTFLRAIQSDIGLDTAKSIKVSSTLPSSLSIDVFPDVIPAEIDRTVDIFVSLLDSDGNPTTTQHDIPIKFFSNNQNLLGDKLDKTMKETKTVIKKGSFGYHLKQEFDLHNYVSNDLMIGVSAEGFGVDTDRFSTVGEAINIDNNKITERDVQVFGISRMPSNSTAVVAFQVHGIENDDDDPPEITANEDTAEEDEKEQPIYVMDELEDGELYPIRVNENYYSTGYVQKLNIVSSDSSLVQISNPGKIDASHSYGVATISSGPQSGKALVSVTVSGVGTDSFLTEIVNTLEQKETRIFSPVGENTILFDRDGFFDVFLVAIDAENRPKKLSDGAKYLVAPTNELVEISKDTTFSFARLHSDSFNVDSGQEFKLRVIPIGEGADLSLETSKIFFTQPSSKIILHLPNPNLNVSNERHVGIIQITDLLGNPITLSRDVKVKVVSGDNNLLRIINDATINQGLSYAMFEIDPTGSLGTSSISASAKGVVGSNIDVKTTSSLTQLKIFTDDMDDIITTSQPVEIKLYVDDENAESVVGASIKIQTDDNSTVTPNIIRTGPDGSATFSVKALKGPSISLDIIATAEGYVDGSETLVIPVDSAGSLAVADLELPEWIVYVVIAAIIMVGVLVMMFLKKSKTSIEEEWEEEEI